MRTWAHGSPRSHRFEASCRFTEPNRSCRDAQGLRAPLQGAVPWWWPEPVRATATGVNNHLLRRLVATRRRPVPQRCLADVSRYLPADLLPCRLRALCVTRWATSTTCATPIAVLPGGRPASSFGSAVLTPRPCPSGHQLRLPEMREWGSGSPRRCSAGSWWSRRSRLRRFSGAWPASRSPGRPSHRLRRRGRRPIQTQRTGTRSALSSPRRRARRRAGRGPACSARARR